MTGMRRRRFGCHSTVPKNGAAAATLTAPERLCRLKETPGVRPVRQPRRWLQVPALPGRRAADRGLLPEAPGCFRPRLLGHDRAFLSTLICRR